MLRNYHDVAARARLFLPAFDGLGSLVERCHPELALDVHAVIERVSHFCSSPCLQAAKAVWEAAERLDAPFRLARRESGPRAQVVMQAGLQTRVMHLVDVAAAIGDASVPWPVAP